MFDVEIPAVESSGCGTCYCWMRHEGGIQLFMLQVSPATHTHACTVCLWGATRKLSHSIDFVFQLRSADSISHLTDSLLISGDFGDQPTTFILPKCFLKFLLFSVTDINPYLVGNTQSLSSWCPRLLLC